MSMDTHQSDADPEQAAADSGEHSVKSKSFVSLVGTQFLGSVNDNMFRWLSIGIAKERFGDEGAALVLALGLACFVAPYLIFASLAGYLADRFSKRKIIVGCKIAEIVIMTLGMIAVFVGDMNLLFLAVFLMGTQSALMGPAKLGSIPEMLRAKSISAANGVLGLFTVVGTMFGTAAGNILYETTKTTRDESWWILAAALLGTAAVGLVVSWGIARLRPANPKAKFPWNPIAETWRDLAALAADRTMLRVAAGIAFFWSIGSLCQLNIDQFGFEGHLNQAQLVPLLVVLVIGVGVGSVLAGIWSAGRVELGILPLGAAGIVVFSVLLFTVGDGALIDTSLDFTGAFVMACIWLFFLGVSAGLFDVPLQAFMQHRSPAETRGSILAASNFLTFAGMLMVSFVYYLLRQPSDGGEPLFNSRQIFLLAGIFTIPVFFYVIWLLPQASIRFFVWLASHTIYRVRVIDRDHLPATGGALLVVNHISWLDGVLLLMTSSRPIRMVAYESYISGWWVRGLSKLWGVIPIAENPGSIRAALKTARKAIRDGELVCIFAEGAISRSGLLQEFKPGFLTIIKNTGCPVVPVYLDELWGSIFSYRGGRVFWKRPKKWPYTVSILFGKPIYNARDTHEVRTAVESLEVDATEKRKSRMVNLPKQFIQACRRRGRKSKIADSMGSDLSGRDVLMRTFILRRLLMREVLSPDEEYVGVLLPPSTGAVLVNAALPLCGNRISVNLNYTVTPEIMAACIRKCGMRHVITSRKFFEKIDIPIEIEGVEVVFIEDYKEKVTTADKISAALDTYLTPQRMLHRKMGLNKIEPDDTITVIFTSGSTGDPKGVMLTNYNVGSNAAAVDHVVQLGVHDVVLGILPFFHSFGFTVTLWTVLTLDVKGVYHFNPLDARPIGKLCQKHKTTIMLSTPTFLRTYLRRIEPQQLESVEVVITGAEKLPSDIADGFEKKFGVRPLEGYGTTELSPLVAVNIPPCRAEGESTEGVREGSVGKTIPGVQAKVIHLETGEDLGVDEPGMLLIKGPNVMKGYLNQPELTAEKIQDGWYVTGDIAQIDAAGFISITGRESRFSKIGGEMVPHIGVEEELGSLLREGDEDEVLHAVVTSVPDKRKGERLVVAHTKISKIPSELIQGLIAKGLPSLWIPSEDSFFEVDEIPVLGTGKLDLKGLKAMALEHFGFTEES